MGLPGTPGSVAPLSINTPGLTALNIRSGLRNLTGLSSPGLHSTSSATQSPAHPHGPFSVMTHHSNYSQSSEVHSREGSLGQLYNIHNPPHSAGSDKDRFVNGSTLSLLQDSTELAMDLWEQVEVLFDDPSVAGVVGTTGKGYLHRAQDVTTRLREGVMALVDGGDEEEYGPEVYENASAFGKVDPSTRLRLIITDAFRAGCSERRSHAQKGKGVWCIAQSPPGRYAQKPHSMHSRICKPAAVLVFCFI